jgi:D-alanine--poly(phosphoribitol) ligase subunit 2
MASHSTDPHSNPKTMLYEKIVELARDLGNDARSLRNDQVIPDTGFLDSPALLELILFYEQTFELDVEQEDLTLDNFGTIDSMAAYLDRHSKPGQS